MLLSEKNRKKIIDMIRSGIKENQPLASINLNNNQIKKLFLEKRGYMYVDALGQSRTASYYVFNNNTLDIIKYINFSNFCFNNVLLNKQMINEIVITDEQKQQFMTEVQSITNTPKEYVLKTTQKTK